MSSKLELSFTSATSDDLERLIALRLEAMRPSLEHLGRFNPERARQRFVNEFQPECTVLVFTNNDLVGCYALIPKDSALYLGHFYVQPQYQGQGIGRVMMERIITLAETDKKDMSLIVLNESPAHRFYESYGFIVTSSDEVETHMMRKHVANR
ncbi:GNAT family N-acetyltransferase [Maritalea sp.]|uniref:GNAT family N-acetyltransferase n=1 Tax=Maritalea sp. TaxID=2003361 RepID=UPI003EF6A67A